ncbi:MAG: CBS domain-containing protein [Nocardioidaceae bacterium]
MHISDVLSSKGSDSVITIEPDATVRTFVERLAEHNIGALVVSDDGVAVLGIVSERDVVRRLTAGGNVLDEKVSALMTTDVHVCEPKDSIVDLQRLMTEHRIRHVPVVVGERLAGIISIGDVVKFRMGELEFERDQLNQYVAGGPQ